MTAICPGCGTRGIVPEVSHGQGLQCPSCGGIFRADLGSVRRWRRMVVAGMALVMVAGVAAAIWGPKSDRSGLEAVTEGFTVCRTDTSPEGRFECVVMEKKTGQGADARYRYRFSIILIGPKSIGGASGDLLEIDAGERPLGELAIRWNAPTVEVLEAAAGARMVARGTVRDGRQYWVDARSIPSTSPATSSPPAAVGP